MGLSIIGMGTMLQQEIKRLAEISRQKVVENRRHLHTHPELSFQEHNTSAFVKQQLDDLGIPWKEMASTGIVAMLKGEKSSHNVVALRADMDALPITELNAVDYRSKNDGVMHACGHDAHTASLLGTASILHSIRDKFGGTVKFIFQPGEEKLPGGASQMIQEGVLSDPTPEAVFGQHVMPLIETGKIGVRKGKHMASMDELYVKVIGRGGHGAMPHENIDPVIIASHILIGLQQLVSRNAKPGVPSVLSFGKVIANGSTNVIPDEVYLEGTFRTMDEVWRDEAHKRMCKMAESIAEGMGGRCEFRIARGYPVLMNEEKTTDRFIQFASEYLGEENIVPVDIWMAAEDFAYYSQVTDSCFYLLGTRNEKKGITSLLHTPTFNVDENALLLSTGLMAYVAVRAVGN
jgi:amidohydrolase